MKEWKASIRAGLSISYYERVERVEKSFGDYLQREQLFDQPISAITVRDVQKFLSEMIQEGYKKAPKAQAKKTFPKEVNFRLLDREKIIDRCASYNLNKKGAKIGKETAERKWGLKHVTCHGLRHTYCSLLLTQNVPIQTVSRYMGHSDSTITLKVYSHFIPDTQGIAVNALNQLVC